MLHVIATVCLLYSLPEHKCKDIVLSFDAPGLSAIHACMSPYPISYLAQWVEAHPKWYVKRYTCKTGDLPKAI